jgi:hypothetical protein
MVQTLDLTKPITNDQVSQVKLLAQTAGLDTATSTKLLDVFDTLLKASVTNKSSVDDGLLSAAVKTLDNNVSK